MGIMKKSLFALICAIISSCIAGCEDNNDMCWDISGLEMAVSIVDEDGADLLDSDSEGNIIGRKATLVIDGVATDYVIEPSHPYYRSRTYVPVFYGVALSSYDGINMLNIGAFDGNDTCSYEMELIISGQTHSIKMTNNVTWKNGEPKVKRHYYFDGRQCDGFATIVIPR